MRPRESWADRSPHAARPGSPTGISGSRNTHGHPGSLGPEAAHRYAFHPHLGHEEVPASVPPSQGLWSMTSGEPECCKCITLVQQSAHWCGARLWGKTETHFPEEVEDQLFVLELKQGGHTELEVWGRCPAFNQKGTWEGPRWPWSSERWICSSPVVGIITETPL